VKRSSTYLIGIVIIAAFMSLGYGEWKRSITAYVTIPEAMASKTMVQVRGELMKDRTTFDEKTGDLIFYLRDKSGSEMKVAYAGSKPGNFDQASHVVAVGRYEGGMFRAQRLLVKCPSKYQGTETAK